MIKVTNLTKVMQDQNVLENISFTIEKGSVVGLIGPNGSGKTTIMKHLARLLKPTRGSINCSNQISYFMGDEDLGFHSVSVQKYLNFMTDVYQKDINTQLLQTILNDFNLPLQSKMKHLSRGEKVKLELAIVLARDTDIYLLDEPFNGVDVVLRDFILENILRYIDIESKIIIISSHELVDIEKIIDNLIFLNQGEIIDQCSIDSIRSNFKVDLLTYYKEKIKQK